MSEKMSEKMAEKMSGTRFSNALLGAAKPLYRALPVIVGAMLLVSMASALLSKEFLSGFFGGNIFFDTLIASAAGSILAGNPVTSYVLGGEFLKLGVSLAAVTAFLVSWVTVGVVQLPAEMLMLGKRFAVTRNVLSFVFSIVVAMLTVFLLTIL